MKTDWKDAPEWARWLAMDGNGSWFWHEHKPTTLSRSSLWATEGIDCRVARAKIKNQDDWRETLEQRPE